jgi:predicted dehydrogenase
MKMKKESAHLQGRIKIGFVGVRYGANLLVEIHQGSGCPYFTLAGVYDLNAERAQTCANRYGVKAYPDLAELLADPEIQAIGLITPPDGRAGLIRQIIRAGKDVMTTKPFELDPQAALDVLQEAECLGRVVHLNSPSTLPSPDLAQIIRWIEEYDLGRPIAGRSDSWGGWGAGESADGSWYDDPKRCPVAPIFRIGIYGINDLVRLWGEAEEVNVMQARLIYQRPTSDTAQVGVRFKNGAIGNFFASLVVQDNQPREGALILNYARGTIYRNIGNQVAGGQTRLALAATCRGEIITQEITYPGWSGDYQWDVFHRAMCGENIVGRVTKEQIVASLKIIQAMMQTEQTQAESIRLPQGERESRCY